MSCPNVQRNFNMVWCATRIGIASNGEYAWGSRPVHRKVILIRLVSSAFTLIELLVVMSIIALLVAILLPVLGATRQSTQLLVCGTRLKQIGVAIHAYAADQDGSLAHGSDDPLSLFSSLGANWSGATWAQVTTNQLWVSPALSPPAPGMLHGLGLILDGYMTDPRAVFCPSDDTNDPIEELAKAEARGIGPFEDAYSSYFYRQLDQATGTAVADLGFNEAGHVAQALAFDANNTDDNPQFYRTNHRAMVANILYLDGHVVPFHNEAELFSLAAVDNRGFPNMTNTMRALDRILVRADFAPVGNPRDAPKLP